MLPRLKARLDEVCAPSFFSLSPLPLSPFPTLPPSISVFTDSAFSHLPPHEIYRQKSGWLSLFDVKFFFLFFFKKNRNSQIHNKCLTIVVLNNNNNNNTLFFFFFSHWLARYPPPGPLFERKEREEGPPSRTFPRAEK